MEARKGTYMALEYTRKRVALLRRGPAEVDSARRVDCAVTVLSSRVAKDGISAIRLGRVVIETLT